MRRTLFVSMALVAAVNAPAVAQTCLGLASFSKGNIQVSGNGQFTEGANTFGAGFSYGLPKVFGGAQLSTTSYDAADASSIGIGANLGYQLTLGKAANIHVCPVASLELGMGPDSEDAPGNPAVDRSQRHATLGFSIGTTMAASPRMQIVPVAGLGFRNSRLSEEGSDAISDTYGVARLGVGLLFNQTIAVRPSVDIPVGLEGSDPTFGLTVAYSFGTKASPSRKR
jgi:hypothetical protein